MEIYIANLDEQSTVEQIRKSFSYLGELSEIKIVGEDPESHTSTYAVLKLAAQHVAELSN